MNATVAWSYQLLDADEQHAFRRFGVLPGLFPIDAAAEVLAGGERDRWAVDRVLQVVAGLIDKSLLLRAPNPGITTCPLYYMLETVRAYAVVELTADERDDATEGLVRYSIGEAALAADGLRGPLQVEWLDRVREELDTHRAAVSWLLERDRCTEASAIVWGLFFFWVIRGRAAEARRWCELILQRPSLPPAVESRALLGAGAMAYTQAQLGDARTALTRVRSFAEAAGDMELEIALAENLLGHVEYSVGHVDAARSRFDRAVESFRALALPWGLGNSLTGQAAVALMADDTDQAEGLLDEATAALRPTGPWFMALTLNVRGILAVRRNQPLEAIASARESLSHIRQLHDKFAFVYALVPLAAAAVLKGDVEWAGRILGAREAITERTGATVVDRWMDHLIEQAERDARARLGPQRWASAVASGRGISIDALMTEIDRVLRKAGAGA